MGDEEVITQLGLLLTQMRYTRHALEGIERATTKYAGLALQVSGGTATGAPWGAPPLFEGALKVYVVNIRDLTEGASVGDVVAGVLGGAGRFVGGFVGGLAGGALSGIAFPWLVGQVNQILSTLDRILARIGTAGDSKAGAGATLADQLQSVSRLLREVAGLFTAAGSAPGEGGAGAAEGGNRLEDALKPALAVAVAATHLVDGLILAVPLLVGALAWLLNHLSAIELAVLDLMEFGLRAVLLLRAAVLGTVLDTLSLAGRLAATTLGLVITALDAIIPAAFRLLVAGLDAALTVLQIASTGLSRLVDGLMLWIRDGLGAMLIFIGGLRVFRLLEHLVQIAPAVLPAIARIAGTPLTPAETSALTAAAAIPVPTGGVGGAGAPGSVSPPPFPDVVGLALPPSARRDLLDAVGKLGTSVATETHTGLTAVQGMLGGIGTTFRSAVDGLDRNLGDEIRLRSRIAGADVGALTDAMKEARRVAAEKPAQTGLQAIAEAYENWLRGGGMRTLMDQISTHFRTAPTEGTDAARSIPGRTVSAVLADREDRRVVVEIDEVVIELGEPPRAAGAGGDRQAAAFDPQAYLDWQSELDDRAAVVAAG